MSELSDRCRAAWTLLIERIGRRFPLVAERPQAAALIAGGVLVFVLLLVCWSWLGTERRPAGQVPIGETTQRIVCQACDYDQGHPLAEIRTWQRDEVGFYPCPSCGAQQADRFRAGGLRVIRPSPAGESRTPPSDESPAP